MISMNKIEVTFCRYACSGLSINTFGLRADLELSDSAGWLIIVCSLRTGLVLHENFDKMVS